MNNSPAATEILAVTVVWVSDWVVANCCAKPNTGVHNHALPAHSDGKDAQSK